MRTGTAAAIGALLIATLFWAGNYVVGGAAVSAIPPLDLVALRWAIAVIPLFALAQLVERPDWRHVARSWHRVLLPALSGLVAYTYLLYKALQYTDAVSASLINAFNPALIAVAAAVFLREPLTSTTVAGVVVALVGVLWVLCDGHPTSLLSSGFGLGDVFMLGAIVVWTTYTLAGRRRTGIPPITSTALQALVSVIALAPVVLLTGGPHWPATSNATLALLFIGVGPSVVSSALWNQALTTIPPARAGVFLNLITVFTVLISLALGKPFTVAEAMGGAVVLFGVTITNAQAFRGGKARSDARMSR
ncbi:DMT family transporter [Streptomyces cavernae]|uniref:DMT family transporter n=1 Tax=Streptomyces cavernae TaxID=2259034 RepID=UPI000FEBF0F7|nr:DMT family transporter [Streptomyces cavernae]